MSSGSPLFKGNGSFSRKLGSNSPNLAAALLEKWAAVAPRHLGSDFLLFKWAALSHLNWPSFKTWSLGSETTVENGRTTKGRQRFGRKTVLKCGSVYKEESTKGSAPCPKARVCTGCLKLRQMVKGVPTYIGQPPPSLKEYSLEYSLVFSAIPSFFYLR